MGSECQNCGFPIGCDHNFCSHCGQRLAIVAVALECQRKQGAWEACQARVSLADLNLTWRLRLTNRGVGAPLDWCSRDFLSEPKLFEVPTGMGPGQLAPGESLVLPLRLRQDGVTADWCHLRISFKDIAEARVLLSSPPKLEVIALNSSLTIDEDIQPTFQMEVHALRGSVMASEFRVTTPGVTLEEMSSELLTPGSPLLLSCSLSADLTRRLVRQRAVALTVALGLSDGKALNTSVQLLQPSQPMLRGRTVQPRLELQVLEGFEATSFVLEIGNGFPEERQRRPWRILEVSADSDDPSFRFELCEPRQPVTVASGESVQVRFRVATDTFPGFFRILIKGHGETLLNLPTRLERLPREPYCGWLVVDLGTRGTCVVGYNSGEPDPDLAEALTDSSVSYNRLQPSKELAIGGRARTFLETSEGRLSGRIDPKREMLTGVPDLNIVPTQEPLESYQIPATQLLVDYLDQLVQGLQESLWTKGRRDVDFTQVVLCHPCRQTEEQRQIYVSTLRRALRQRTIQQNRSKMKFIEIPEAVAAALYFTQSFVNRLRRPATLMVYDLGGSSLDLCLIQLEPGSPGHWSVLGVDGVLDVGGEKLIETVFSEMVRNLAQRFPGKLLLTSEPSHPQAHRERAFLRRAAEDAVIKFCQDETAEYLLQINDGELHYQTEGGLEPARLDDPLSISSHTLRPALDPILKTGFDRMEAFLTRLSCQEPDIVARSGRASGFPLIDQHLRMRFSRATYLVADEPKFCLVRGASLHPRLRAPGGLVMQKSPEDLWLPRGEGELILVASIGVEAAGVFQEILPAGTKFGSQHRLTDVLVVDGNARLVLLQNFGGVNHLRLENGDANPEIRPLAEAAVPEEYREQSLDFLFELLPGGGLLVTLHSRRASEVLFQIEANRLAVKL